MSTSVTDAQLRLLGLTRAQWNLFPPDEQQNMLTSLMTLGQGDATTKTQIGPEKPNTITFTEADAQAAAQNQYLNQVGDQASMLAGKPGLLGQIANSVGNSSVAHLLDGPASAAQKGINATTHGFSGLFGPLLNFLSGLFSANLWDRVLFVLGGVLLVIVGIVLLLHKSAPAIPIPV